VIECMRLFYAAGVDRREVLPKGDSIGGSTLAEEGDYFVKVVNTGKHHFWRKVSA